MGNVYLDHHIPRDSFRYIDHKWIEQASGEQKRIKSPIRLRDVIENEWFMRLRKPDFQRETNAWTPIACIELLESIVNNLVVPSIIAWKNEETGTVYIIDGAHRLSVLRAWMLDDWGDRQIEYYNEYRKAEIISAANEVRRLLGERVGSYKSYIQAHKDSRSIFNAGGAPKKDMQPDAFKRAQFYSEILDGHPLVTQWVEGSYEDAEKSFLRINRCGVHLGSFEQLLIEYRNSPYARVTSSIVSAGKAGHFWPNVGIDERYQDKINQFSYYSKAIHNILFMPPFADEIRDLNQPLVVSKPGDRYEDTLELLTLVVDNCLLGNEDLKKEILSDLSNANSSAVIDRSETIFLTALDRLSHLVGENANPRTLSIVPLVYTYNHQGAYSPNLFYGFCYWLFTGSDDDIRTKKLALCATRGDFEKILMDFKSDITSVASRKGGRFKTTKDIAETINTIVSLLISNVNKTMDEKIRIISKQLKFIRNTSSDLKSRIASRRQRNQVNISNLFDSSIRCRICSGLIDLKQGKQYDHFFEKFAAKKTTNVANLVPTHPFCNNMKDTILRIKSETEPIQLPTFLKDTNRKPNGTRQLTLFDLT